MNSNYVYRSRYINNIYLQICNDLLNYSDYTYLNDIDGKHIYEIVNPTIVLTESKNCFATIREMNFDYLKGELEFYLSGSPYLKDISVHSKFWNNVTDDNMTINSNYGRLLLYDRNTSNYTQFEYAKNCLLKNICSKKAVMLIYDKEHSRKSNDNPCTIFLQFLYREKKLHIFVHMRSQDIYYGLPYDIPFFVLLQHKMAKELSIEVGDYVHNATSLHLYEKDKKNLLKAIDNHFLKEISSNSNNFPLDQQDELFNKFLGGYLC